MSKKVIQVPVDDELLEDLVRLARQERQSRSEVIRRACRSYVDAREREEMDRLYEEGYRRNPESPEIALAQESLLAQVLTEESW